MGDFKIEIPFMVKGKGATSNAQESSGSSNSPVKKLTESIVKSLGISKILGDILGDVYKLISPLIRILSVMAILIFLPLMPVIKFLAKKLAEFAKLLATGGKEGIIGYIIALLVIIGAVLLVAFGGWIVGILAVIGALLILVFGEDLVNFLLEAWELLKVAFQIITEGLQSAWELWLVGFRIIGEGLKFVWELLKIGWFFLINAGMWVWEKIIKPGFKIMRSIGRRIWNIIKAPFEWLANKIRSLPFMGGGRGKSVRDAIIRPNGDVIETDPADYLIATKNPSSLGGSTTININNPSVRQTSDIKLIANEVSRALQRQMIGRVSST